MRIGVMAYSFAGALRRGEMTLPRVLEFVAALGVREVELVDAQVDALGVEPVRDRLRALGLSVSCYDIVRADPVQSTEAERQAAEAKLRAGLDDAASLGAGVTLVVPGPYRVGVERERAKAELAATLTRLTGYAAERGIALTIEDFGVEAATGCTSDSLLELCRAAPGLGVTYDSGNFVFGGQSPLEAWDTLAPLVRHVHVKDFVVAKPERAAADRYRRSLSGEAYMGAVLGHGLIANAEIVARIRAGGYGGSLSVEYEGPDDPRPSVREGVEYLRQLL